MKSSLRAVPVFFILFLVLVFVSAVMYYLYFDCQWIGAGSPPDLQPARLFVEGVLAVWDICAVIALLPVLFYFIQFKTAVFSGFSVWFFLCALVCLVIQPLSFITAGKFATPAAEKHLDPLYVDEYDGTVFTPGFFRAANNGIVYFTEIDRINRSVSGLVLPLRSGRAMAGQAVLINENHELFKTISGIPDPLIVREIPLPPYIRQIISEIYALKQLGFRAFSPGIPLFSATFFIEYAGFLSINLALLGLYAFAHFSSWRLLNALFLPVCYAVILHVNYLIQCVGAGARFFAFFPQEFPVWGRAVIVNCLILLILAAAGFTGVLSKKNHPEEESA